MANLTLLPTEGPAAVSIWTRIAALRQHDVCCLAPKFRDAVERGVARANKGGLDVVVFETCRSDELQRIYYDQGTTHAKTADYSWHKYGLAVDLTHRVHGWDLYPGGTAHDPAWVARLEAHMKAEALLDWGGDWHSPDWPHWNWGRCAKTPTYRSIEAYERGGKEAVWPLVGAI